MKEQNNLYKSNMKDKQLDLYNAYSLKEVLVMQINEKYKNRLQRFIIKHIILKLIPESFSEEPIQNLMTLQKGGKIGQVCIKVDMAGVSKYNGDGSKTDLTDEFSKEGLEQFNKDLGILPENNKKSKPLWILGSVNFRPTWVANLKWNNDMNIKKGTQILITKGYGKDEKIYLAEVVEYVGARTCWDNMPYVTVKIKDKIERVIPNNIIYIITDDNEVVKEIDKIDNINKSKK